MPSILERTIYGESKTIGFDKFNIGVLLKSIAYDLEEFGQKGVQGLAIKSKEAEALIKYEKNAKRAADPYIIAGTVSGHLCLLVRDKKAPSFEAITVVVRDYKKLRDELAKNNAQVVNIHPYEDKIVEGSVSALENKYKTTGVEKWEADFGDITGDIVLCAHGEPTTKPGRVIGKELGEMSVDAMVKFLTGNSDKAKRIGKDYSGKITLVGCYTASGGPEGDKQDDAYAKKVRDALVKKGYKNLVVVGMPGPAAVARGDENDSSGKPMKRGDVMTYPSMDEDDTGIEAKRKQIDKLTEGLIEASKKSPDPKNFMATPGAKSVLSKIAELEKEMQGTANRLKDGTEKKFSGLQGTFGLRKIKSSLGL